MRDWKKRLWAVENEIASLPLVARNDKRGVVAIMGGGNVQSTADGKRTIESYWQSTPFFCGLGGSQRWKNVVIMILSCSYLFNPLHPSLRASFSLRGNLIHLR
jgi:hypothetical protein